jgi:hypothetical protein
MTHDDEYESEWAEVPTGAEGPISEDALGRHLIRRGVGAAPDGLAAAISARVAETKREPSWRRTARSLRPAAAIAACLVVVLIGGLIATAKPAPDGGPGTTSFDPATRPMTVAELARYVASGTAAGKTVIVDDSIDDSGTYVSCATADNCPIGVLVGYGAATHRASDLSSWVFPADPAVRPDDPAIAGPLALRVRSGGRLHAPWPGGGDASDQTCVVGRGRAVAIGSPGCRRHPRLARGDVDRATVRAEPYDNFPHRRGWIGARLRLRPDLVPHGHARHVRDDARRGSHEGPERGVLIVRRPWPRRQHVDRRGTAARRHVSRAPGSGLTGTACARTTLRRPRHPASNAPGRPSG